MPSFLKNMQTTENNNRSIRRNTKEQENMGCSISNPEIKYLPTKATLSKLSFNTEREIKNFHNKHKLK